MTSPPATSSPDIEETAARLRLSATRLARRLRQQSGTGLSPSQLSALASVDIHGPMTLGALAEHERVAPPTVTKVVAKLETDGLLSREPDATDRRIVRVTTTAAGRSLLAESRKRKNAWLAEQIGELTVEQRRRLHAALDVLDLLTTKDPA